MKKFTELVRQTAAYLSEADIGNATPLEEPQIGQLGDNTPIAAELMDTRPYKEYGIGVTCVAGFKCDTVPSFPTYNTSVYHWIEQWLLLLANWNNPQWNIANPDGETLRSFYYNFLRMQYGLLLGSPDKDSWPYDMDPYS